MIIRFVALLAILGAAALAAFAQDVQIRINQAGYQASDIKKAVVFSKEPLSGFVGAEDLSTGKPTPLRMPLRPILLHRGAESLTIITSSIFLR